MRVAIFTDNDFGKVNGVTTTLSAVLKHAPASMALRVYTADGVGAETPHYLALRSLGVPIPFYGEMKMHVPRLAAYLRHAREDGIDLIHLTTPGPLGLTAMRVARRLGLPMVGTFHTDLAAYTAILSGWPRLGALMREYMRWPYSRCDRVLVPSEATRRLVIGAKEDPTIAPSRCAGSGAPPTNDRPCSTSGESPGRRDSIFSRRCRRACARAVSHTGWCSRAMGRSSTSCAPGSTIRCSRAR
jgi:hypothetical protein